MFVFFVEDRSFTPTSVIGSARCPGTRFLVSIGELRPRGHRPEIPHSTAEESQNKGNQNQKRLSERRASSLVQLAAKSIPKPLSLETVRLSQCTATSLVRNGFLVDCPDVRHNYPPTTKLPSVNGLCWYNWENQLWAEYDTPPWGLTRSCFTTDSDPRCLSVSRPAPHRLRRTLKSTIPDKRQSAQAADCKSERTSLSIEAVGRAG